MKIKFYWVALASAAMIAQAKAGTHQSSGRSGSVEPVGAVPARSSAVSPSRGAPTGNLGRLIYAGQHSSPIGPRSSLSLGSLRHSANPNVGTLRSRDFSRGYGNGRIARSSHRSGAIAARNAKTTLRADWRQHVFAQRSAGWQRNWDRRRDHWWQGHRCHFFNGSWFIFDLGFYPWDTFFYPYDSYYANGYGYNPYPYSYNPDYYDSYQGEDYYPRTSPVAVDQYTDSMVSAAQERLARQGYYRGQIDGIPGSRTRRAIARYQEDHGERVTGELTVETLQTLGLREVASY